MQETLDFLRIIPYNNSRNKENKPNEQEEKIMTRTELITYTRHILEDVVFDDDNNKSTVFHECYVDAVGNIESPKRK